MKIETKVIIALMASCMLVSSSLPAIAAGNGNGIPPIVIGNRLSFPVIWAEGVEKVLPGESGMVPELGDWVYWWGAPLEDGTLQSCERETEVGFEYYCEDGDDLTGTTPTVLPQEGWQPVYPQQNAQNTWQAGSADASTHESTVIDDTTIIGNELKDRTYASDYPATVGVLAKAFIVVPDAVLPEGTLENFQTWNQATGGSSPFPSAGNIFYAYVLRPTETENKYEIVFKSNQFTVPPLTTLGISEVATFPVDSVSVQAGDIIGFYGQGVPLDIIDTGTDILSYLAPELPAEGSMITLGVSPFPIIPQDRTYSIAAEVSTGGTGGPTGRVVVDWIDWGDSIESIDWTTNSKVRLEVVLLKDLSNPMLQYTMNHISGWGIDEMWGLAATGDPVDNDPVVDAIEGDGEQATVYSHCARQTIQKLLVPRNNPSLADLVWTWDVYKDESGNREPGWAEWDDENEVFVYPSDLISDIVLFNGAVHEAEGEGSGDYYSAEINIKGKIMYGYTWSVRDLYDNSGGSQAGEGYYRVTFSLDETCGDVTRNTDFVDPDTQIFLPIEVIEEEAVTILAESDDSDSGSTPGGVAVIDYGNSLTYIDLNILLKSKTK